MRRAAVAVCTPADASAIEAVDRRAATGVLRASLPAAPRLDVFRLAKGQRTEHRLASTPYWSFFSEKFAYADKFFSDLADQGLSGEITHFEHPANPNPAARRHCDQSLVK